MDNLVDIVRGLIIALVVAITALVNPIQIYFDPINGALQSILGLLLINFLVGFVTGLVIQDESFSFKKFKVCVGEGALFLGLISFTFYLGERNGNATETIYCVTAIAYIIIYCYSVNLLKNIIRWLTKGTPCYVAVNMIYYILTIEFIKKFPMFDKYKTNPDPDNNDNTTR